MTEYSKAERKVITAIYPRAGAAACAELLPGRTPAQIGKVARRMGLRCYPAARGKVGTANAKIRKYPAPSKPQADPSGPHLAGGARTLPAKRRCLGCKTVFLSEHCGNRICERCKNGHVWRSAPPSESRPVFGGGRVPRAAGAD